MSMPNFPEISSDITRERALDMILASIAMEELEVIKSLSINQLTI